MQSLSVQALTLRQLGRLTLSPRQLLTTGHGPHWTEWCPRTLHCRQLWGSTSFLYHGTYKLLSGVDPAASWSVHHARFKSSKKAKGARARQEEESDDEADPDSDYEDELEHDKSLPKDYKDMERFVPSLRYDLILKSGLDIARNKVEDAFYGNMLRLNGKKLLKKSKSVSVGDTLDLIMSEDKETDTVTLCRVMVKKVLGESQDGDKCKIALRRWKSIKLSTQDAFKQ